MKRLSYNKNVNPLTYVYVKAAVGLKPAFILVMF